MGIAGNNAVAMVNVHHVAIAARVPTCIHHHAVSSSHNRRTAVVGNINAWMIVGTTPPQTKWRADITAGWPDGRHIGIDGIFIIPLPLLLLHGILQLLDTGLADSHPLLQICQHSTDIFWLQLLAIWAALAVVGTITVALRHIGCCRIHASNLPKLHLHLAQLAQLILQAVCPLGQLQQLLLLDIIYLLEPLNLGCLVSQGIAGVGGIAKGSYQQKCSCHGRGNAALYPFLRQANAADIISLARNDLDGIFLLFFFCFLCFQILVLIAQGKVLQTQFCTYLFSLWG